jgi:uncharacterized protein (DUF2164 family)
MVIDTKKERIFMKKTLQLSPEQQKDAIAELKNYFQNERDEELTDLAGILLLDFITEKLGPMFYNKGISDAQRFMGERVEDLYALILKESTGRR